MLHRCVGNFETIEQAVGFMHSMLKVGKSLLFMVSIILTRPVAYQPNTYEESTELATVSQSVGLPHPGVAAALLHDNGLID